jgi:hypothetical protein
MIMSRNLDRLSQGMLLGLSRIIDAKHAGGEGIFFFWCALAAARPT